ncbi:WxL protein peptidoglycan domain-containing protein [Cellulosimicrobium sp. NPDC057862]|uniref:WxL protein peptidoglycan domain-containing protein n=1 Tax=Cellulosimicrobium sp. NPDC057862 TaxID=3346266 RepID=UPI00366F4D87
MDRDAAAPVRTHRPARGAAALVAVLAVLLALVPAGTARAGGVVPSVPTAPTVPVASTLAGDATDDLSWGLLPADDDHGTDRPNFSYAVRPGDTISDTVVVTNHSAQRLELRTYAADAFTTTSGQLDLLPAGEGSTDLGAWITLGSGTVTVDPGQSLDVPFTIAVPADALPGDHSAGVITSLVQQASASTVALDRRLALRVHARVEGALAPAVEVSEVEVVHHDVVNPFGTSSATVRYTLTNTGNARVVPAESVVVTGPFGWAATTAGDGELPELLPGSALEREVVVTGVRPLGRADATVDVAATAVGIGGGATASDDGAGQAWAVPWAALALLGLVLLAALRGPALLAALRRRAARAASGGGRAAGSATSAAVPKSSAAGSAPEAGAAAQDPAPLTAAQLEEALERARAEGRAQALAERGGGEPEG